MSNPKTALHSARPARELLPGAILALLLFLVLPAMAWADSPVPPAEGSEKCADCHQAETEAWQGSAHAEAMKPIDSDHAATCAESPDGADCNCLTCHTTDFNPVSGTFAYGGVTCEACHGDYVEGHPAKGAMQLSVDSSICQDCHAPTYEQWTQSSHGDANVQCISCHLSHSQEFRLTDEAQCGTCHRNQLNDFAHTAHNGSNITCTDCHLSSPVEGAASADNTGGKQVPSHSFAVASEACINCHGQTIHQDLQVNDEVSQAGLAAPADQMPALAARLKDVESTNTSLKSLAATGLGVGVGIGGMLGIIFMLVVGCIGQKRAKS